MNDIVSTKESPGIFDAFESAKPGEPLFTLQGGDPHAPATVLHWAKLARAAGMEEPDERKARVLLVKASTAEEVAWAMQAYQRGDVEVEGERSRYNEEAPALAVKDRHDTLTHGARRIDNAVFELKQLSDRIKGYDDMGAVAIELAEVAEALRVLSAKVRPHRGARS